MLNYQPKRTDDIELLFQAASYLQLIPGCESQTEQIKHKLMFAFHEFPVLFDNTKKAYRESTPFRYHESGVVTASHLDDNQCLVLDTWEPENRPVYHKRKTTATSPKPSHVPILNINPIWYLQLMHYENRKTTRHRKSWGHQITPYVNYYREAKIVQTLPADEQAAVAPFAIRDRNQNVFRSTLDLLHLRTYTMQFSYQQRNTWNKRLFFFLTDKELKQLSVASANDAIAVKKSKNKELSVRDRARVRIHHTRDAIEQIINNPTAERLTLNLKDIVAHTTESIPRDGQEPYECEIIDHIRSWENLHTHYLNLTDVHLGILRELNLLDDKLLGALETEVQDTTT